MYASGTCHPCPDSAMCDGSASILCQTGYYQTFSATDKIMCQACPAGALCPDGSGVCYFRTNSELQKCPNSDLDLVGDWIKDKTARAWTLRSCPLGYLAINSSRDTSGCTMCDAMTYSLDSISGCQDGVCTARKCTQCPEGAICQKGSLPPPHFVPKHSGAEWSTASMSSGEEVILRLTSCPPGFALIRTPLPASDTCEKCPAGKYNVERAVWRQQSQRTQMDDYCRNCPKIGIDCPGGDVVVAHAGWFAIRELVPAPLARRSQGESQATHSNTTVSTHEHMIVNVYECSLDACGSNNTCKNNRTGILCGLCPSGYAFQSNGCKRCETNTQTVAAWKQVLFTVFSVVYVLVLYVVGWTYIVPLPHLPQRFRSVTFQWMGEKINNAQDLFNPNTLKMALQGAKIFISYFQVIFGFMPFKVKWPAAIMTSLVAINKLKSLLKINLFRVPGLSCMFDMDYQSELMLQTCFPIVIGACLWVPVPVAWILRRYARRLGTAAAQCSSDRMLEGTQVAFWNNMLLWVFLVFPSASLWALQGFLCRHIGDASYLSYDLRQDCPWKPWSAIASYSVVFAFIWPFGVPVLLSCLIVWYDVPKLARTKIARELLQRLLNLYMDDTKSSVFSRTGAVDSLTLQELVTLRNHRWQRPQECPEATEIGICAKTDVKEEEENSSDLHWEKVEKVEKEEEKKEEAEKKETFVKFYSTLQGQSSQMRETWNFMQILYTTDSEYDEERLPLLFLEFAARLQKKLLHKMLVSENDLSYDDVEWSSWQNLILEISAHEELVKAIVDQHIGQITRQLHEQHILALPPLAWDGSLGVEERLVINRLGFLLSAYQVQTYWWELVELMRKLVLTCILHVAYDGSTSQLSGSLLTTFIFLMLHLRVDPYLSKVLNSFQRLVLVSQFLTISGGIIIVLKENAELLQATASENETEKNIVGALILCVNITAAFLYPAYRILKAGFSLFETDRYYEGCKGVYVYFMGAPPQHKDDSLEQTIQHAKMLLLQESHRNSCTHSLLNAAALASLVTHSKEPDTHYKEPKEPYLHSMELQGAAALASLVTMAPLHSKDSYSPTKELYVKADLVGSDLGHRGCKHADVATYPQAHTHDTSTQTHDDDIAESAQAHTLTSLTSLRDIQPENCNQAPAAARILAMCSLNLRLPTRRHGAAAAPSATAHETVAWLQIRGQRGHFSDGFSYVRYVTKIQKTLKQDPIQNSTNARRRLGLRTNGSGGGGKRGKGGGEQEEDKVVAKGVETTRVLARWQLEGSEKDPNREKDLKKDKGGCEALLAIQAHQHRNRVRRKIFESIKHRSMAAAFALWRLAAYDDASACGDGASSVVARKGRSGKGGEMESPGYSSASYACLAITTGGRGGGEVPRGCTHAQKDACQICFSENPRQAACSHSSNDASYDDLEAGLSEAGLC